jgi:hypothetical protein
MAFMQASEVLPGDRIRIDQVYIHDDLAGLKTDIGVVAVAQLIGSRDMLIFPDDDNPEIPFQIPSRDGVILRQRDATEQTRVKATELV